MQTIITLSKELKLNVTAEGVESENELLLLRQLGCDVAQGYLISKPLEAAEIPGFLDRFNAG